MNDYQELFIYLYIPLSYVLWYFSNIRKQKAESFNISMFIVAPISCLYMGLIYAVNSFVELFLGSD